MGDTGTPGGNPSRGFLQMGTVVPLLAHSLISRSAGTLKGNFLGVTPTGPFKAPILPNKSVYGCADAYPVRQYWYVQAL